MLKMIISSYRAPKINQNLILFPGIGKKESARSWTLLSVLIPNNMLKSVIMTGKVILDPGLLKNSTEIPIQIMAILRDPKK